MTPLLSQQIQQTPTPNFLAKAFRIFALSFALAGVCFAESADPASSAPSDIYVPGDAVEVKGQTLYVKDTTGTTLLLSIAESPTATIGDFITPVAATGTPGQAGTGREPVATINGSGLSESYPGSGVFVHVNDSSAGGASMWNTGFADTAFLEYDLGAVYNVSGLYQWNYNEKPPYNERGLKEVKISTSDDGTNWKKRTLTVFEAGTGQPDLAAEVIKFEQPVKTRYIRLDALSRYGSDAFGFSEIRFANADKAYKAPSRVWSAKYTRPVYPARTLGQKTSDATETIFPEAAKIVDVSQPPYNAKGDGTTMIRMRFNGPSMTIPHRALSSIFRTANILSQNKSAGAARKTCAMPTRPRIQSCGARAKKRPSFSLKTDAPDSTIHGLPAESSGRGKLRLNDSPMRSATSP
jgi:hypothetical protein